MRVLISLILFIYSVCTWALAPGLQQALDKARQDLAVSGMQMTLILPTQEHIVLTSGTIEKNPKSAPILPDTLFQIGSTTKSFTAAVILKLAEEKKLKLSDPISKFFPEYKQWANVTVSQLLHNNSGIPSFSENTDFQKTMAANYKRVWTQKELVDIAAKIPMNFNPGEGWHYSNTNFILAGLIAEQVAKQPIAVLYQKYFFGPLKLTHTYYIPGMYSENVIKQMAHGYDDGRDVIHDNMSWAGTAGAIISNSNDLATWAYALFHGKVLKPDSLAEMKNVVSTKTGLYDSNTKEGYGMAVGMRVNEKYGRWYGHEGETLGYHSIFMWFPEPNLTVAILTNGEAKNLRQFAETLPGYVG